MAYKMFIVRCSPEEHERAFRFAHERGKSLSAIIREFLASQIKKQDRKAA